MGRGNLNRDSVGVAERNVVSPPPFRYFQVRASGKEEMTCVFYESRSDHKEMMISILKTR